MPCCRLTYKEYLEEDGKTINKLAYTESHIGGEFGKTEYKKLKGIYKKIIESHDGHGRWAYKTMDVFKKEMLSLVGAVTSAREFEDYKKELFDGSKEKRMEEVSLSDFTQIVVAYEKNTLTGDNTDEKYFNY
jgi:hypothetical protein